MYCLLIILSILLKINVKLENACITMTKVFMLTVTQIRYILINLGKFRTQAVKYKQDMKYNIVHVIV